MHSAGNHDNITVAFIDETAVVRVEGRGSFKVSPSLKQFVHRVIDDGLARNISVDMSECCGMDSTFMGVIAGLACFLKRQTDINFQLLNLSVKNKKLLVTLGVDRVVQFSMAGESSTTDPLADALSTQTLDAQFLDKLDAAKTSLDAHQTLVDIKPENIEKFRSVLEYLENDVRNLKH